MAVRDALQGTGIGAGFGVIADVLLTGGDTIWFLLELLIDQGPLLFVLVSRLLSAAPSISWLPQDTLQTVFTGLALALAAVTVYRLVSNLSDRFQQRYDT
jgi:hypothetical protein